MLGTHPFSSRRSALVSAIPARSLGGGFAVELAQDWEFQSLRALNLRFNYQKRAVAVATLVLPEELDSGKLSVESRGAWTRITIFYRNQFRRAPWQLWVRAGQMAGTLEVCERITDPAIGWQWRFQGAVFHTHRGLSLDSRPTGAAAGRMGAFTQFGQLFDLKDWFLVQDADDCHGMVALRNGTWGHPTRSAITLSAGSGTELLADAAVRSAGHRSYLLVGGPSAELLSRQVEGIEYFEPANGIAVWPARALARHGFARVERLARSRRYAPQTPPAQECVFGPDSLAVAMRRVKERPELTGGNPFWSGDMASAKTYVLDVLRRHRDAMVDQAFLHPIGNPVAQRVLGPATATFHLLDLIGAWSNAERDLIGGLLAELADLLMRRDAYPWHYAMRPPECPYGPDSFYRGMLNQNFNTDRYVFVGLVGCALANHPRSAAWRRHAVDQFEQQMRAFVWPDSPDGQGGCWEESHTYANHVKLTLLPLVLALRHAPEAIDLMRDERFAATCRFFIPLLSPRDPLLRGRRGIPAIGDHSYNKHEGYGYLFGWLAGLKPDEAEAYRWAWRETGSLLTDRKSEQVHTFAPFLAPDPDAPISQPALPSLANLNGFGSLARRIEPAGESLLVVRCGDAWGHYHPDEGSFWWWDRGQLICCDSGLGDGPMKHFHVGHNVLGFPSHEPMQYLDRQGFRVTRCADIDGETVVDCDIPVSQWNDGTPFGRPVARAMRPHVRRQFRWRANGTLEIHDSPSNAPSKRVRWSVHAPATDVRFDGERRVVFSLPERRSLVVGLPQKPLECQIFRGETTCGVACDYPAGDWVHILRPLTSGKV